MENSRQITVNDSRINISFKNQDTLRAEQSEEVILTNNHFEPVADILQGMNEMIGWKR
ncbi:hypothetical protein IAQ67_15740 [Paenibacillus peoriae]|uniref:Uncharacterized protein n=1 Tax=Paenibacillus peoriae TaxID=59893 RepID=A0A7H0Y2N9_9BACL|nr:hypothetical protein [Paenibacillus peoriae]QNR65347.1 hypothetical protein IAQ67_15740 [Paenibacillus peoriae]